MSDVFSSWLSALPWFGWVAIVAIASGTVRSIVKMKYQHAERMQKIRYGMDPDAAGKPAPPDEV